MKIFDNFIIFGQNIDCGYTLEPPLRGGSNEYPQSMFWSQKKKNRFTPASFATMYIKVGLTGIYITRTCFCDVLKYLMTYLDFTLQLSDRQNAHNVYYITINRQYFRQCFQPIAYFVIFYDVGFFPLNICY